MRPPERAVLREFWLSIRRGAATDEAAAGLGYTKRTGTRWFRQAGGVVPAYVTAQPGRRNLAFEEREEIFAGVERGDSIRLICQQPGPGALDGAARTAAEHAASAIPTSLPAWLSSHQAVELPTLPGATPGRVHGAPTEAGQAGDQARAARAGASQTEGETQSSADLG